MRRAWLVIVAVLLGALPGAPAAAGRDPVGRIMARMTLEEKVGQLFATYAYGAHATAPAAADAALNRAAYGVDTPAQLVARYHLGGVVYFTWSHNLDAPAQIATLSNGLQAASRVPLLISTDQEQGVVVRMPAPATRFPGAMALGAGRSLPDAYRAAQVTGRELRAVGVNQDFAPVADVNVNPANPVIGVRSFGGDPTLAAAMTAAQVAGLQHGAGTSAAAKHFPGHGDTDTDSHTGLPVINHTRAEWERLDAPPFRAAIAAGVDTVMTAHIVVPALDPAGDPATLSAPILTGLLRERLGFDGVVVTDALTMEGVRQKYGDDRVPVLALKAGADLLLMPPDLDLAYQAVLGAVRGGELSRARIDRSVRRILTLKHERGILTAGPVDPAAAARTVGRAEHRRILQSVTDRTVTAVRNDGGLLPAAVRSRRVLSTGAGDPAGLAATLTARGASATALPTGQQPSDAVTAQAVTAAASHDLVVVQTSNALTDPAGPQLRLVRALAATGTPVVVVAVRDPYELAQLTEVPAQLATFSAVPAAMVALAKVITGEVPPRGRLPVAVPPAYPYGHGLSW
ncbi:glycoside hydrolase family 3 N-terminal domain-containing protein [Phytohabitans sp. ZYX-F-186]|uniref:beta-N-acetylhexosaminidase n=1 Tax=Phytohabitans maris TaxID=3071409 RepID=A0ABU0ZUG9_9ACTN|nr:glycoside hydrolase family 3 N-terminal domain-containing protein [Phytohabitans sp. ZYX-F-186]MDQ7910632.1 glycoside hydrolase family 3 N-terminal domain-containing protein [Phytohabitans sp. ZYX-F-186]